MRPLLAFWPGIATALLVSRGGAEAVALRRTSDWREILDRAFVWCQWNVGYILWIVPGTRNVDDASDRARWEGSSGPYLRHATAT
jgi:hypothetical protein